MTRFDARITVALVPNFFRFAGTYHVLVSRLVSRDGAPEGTGRYGTHTRGFGAVRIDRSDGTRVVGKRFENVGVAVHVAESGTAAIGNNQVGHVAGNAICFGTDYGSFGRSDDGEILGNRIRDVGEVYIESAGI